MKIVHVLIVISLLLITIVGAEFKTEESQNMRGSAFTASVNCQDQIICYYLISEDIREIDPGIVGYWCSTEQSLVQKYCYVIKEHQIIWPFWTKAIHEQDEYEKTSINFTTRPEEPQPIQFTSACLHNETYTYQTYTADGHTLKTNEETIMWCDEGCEDPYCINKTFTYNLRINAKGIIQFRYNRYDPDRYNPEQTKTKCELETERINNLTKEETCKQAGYETVSVNWVISKEGFCLKQSCTYEFDSKEGFIKPYAKVILLEEAKEKLIREACT